MKKEKDNYKKSPPRFVFPKRCFSIEAAIEMKESLIPIFTFFFNFLPKAKIGIYSLVWSLPL